MKNFERFLTTIVFLGFSPAAGAATVNLIQDTQAIECRLSKTGGAGFDRLWIDAKDNQLKLFGGTKVTAEFEQLKFLDSAVLMKRSGEAGPDSRGGQNEVALFQIQRNGETFLLRGGLFSFEEKNCDEAGAAKICKTSLIERLLWSPEKLELKTKSDAFKADVSQYGVFTGRGTFFIAEARGPGDEQLALAILDYGAKVDLIFGRIFKLDCH